MKFNKIKQLTTDENLVLNSVNQSDSVVVKDRGIARKTLLPEIDDSLERSVFVTRLPTSSTIEPISEAFSQFGKVLCVRILKDSRNSDKDSGKAYVEFATLEEKTKAVDAKELKFVYDGTETTLHIKPKIDLSKSKSKRSEDTETSETNTGKIEKNTTTTTTTTTAEEKSESNQSSEEKFVPGVVLKLSDVPKELDRKELKARFDQFGKVRYAEFKHTENHAFIRFIEADVAKAACDAVNQKKEKLSEIASCASILEGDQEQEYWNSKVYPFVNTKGPGKEKGKGKGKGKGRGQKRKNTFGESAKKRYKEDS